MTRSIGVPRIAVVVGALTLAGGASAVVASGVAAAAEQEGNPPPSTSVLNVAPNGKDAASCGSMSAPCATVGQAIANASAGETVLVAPGVYKEQVVLAKPLHLEGDHAVIDALGLSSGSGTTMDAAGILVTATASGSSVAGFSVHGATGEGILVMGASHVAVIGNDVSGNDLGSPTTTKYIECQAQGQVPGDCGEGIHLMSATASAVAGNTVSGNSGGILVTDELGPASDNWIGKNAVTDNLFDCGITLASHSATAVSSSGARQPTSGGVFDNTVAHNIVTDNGTLGEGAGILDAAAAPGGAAYDNLITSNVISGNGMAGVTIHAHATPQDVSGNRIVHNWIGVNNLGGDSSAQVTATTGIVVASSGPSVTVTIADNAISGNSQAVYTTSNVTVTGDQ